MGVAIVTGAARGIGAAIVHALHAAGHDIVAVDRCRDDERLAYPLGTEQELRATAAAAGAEVVIGDVGDTQTAARAVDVARERFGGVDIAIANAGVMAATVPLWQIDDDEWRALFETNVNGTLQLVRAAIPAMLDRPAPRAGRFIGFSSAIAMKATPNLAAYAASKAAVAGLVRSLAADLAGSGITANILQPGSTDTALLTRSAEVYDLASPNEFAAHHLNERLIDPTEIAAAVVWLCSGQSSSITGAVIPVDGGMAAR